MLERADTFRDFGILPEDLQPPAGTGIAVKIIDAMTLRDGGTTCVSIEDAGVTIDDSCIGAIWAKLRWMTTTNTNTGRIISGRF